MEDTEKITLPPIQHVEPKSNIVKIDLALNPVHSSETYKNGHLSRIKIRQTGAKLNQQIEELKFHKKVRGGKKDWEKADCNLELSQSVGIKEKELKV